MTILMRIPKQNEIHMAEHCNDMRMNAIKAQAFQNEVLVSFFSLFRLDSLYSCVYSLMNIRGTFKVAMNVFEDEGSNRRSSYKGG